MLRENSMRKGAFLIATVALLVGIHAAGAAQKRDGTDYARIKSVLGKWRVGNLEVEFTEKVAFTESFASDIDVTFFELQGMNAAYSIVGNEEKALLFLKFKYEGEKIKTANLVVKNANLLVTGATDTGITEWHRVTEDLDVTDHAVVSAMVGYWKFPWASDKLVFYLSDEADGFEKIPDAPFTVTFYKILSPDLGELMPWKSFSVLQAIGSSKEFLILTRKYGMKDFGKLELQGDVLVVNGKRYAVRSTPSQNDEPTARSGSLGVRVSHGDILGLTATKFKVYLKGDESTGFLEREDGSGSSLMEWGYARFGVLPAGKYTLTITGHFVQGGKEISFSMTVDYTYKGGNVICDANVSNKRFVCQ